MTNTTFQTNDRAMQYSADLPTSESIAVPAIAEAVDRFRVADDRLRRLRREVQVLDSAIAQAIKADQRRAALAVEEGAETIENPTELEDLARDALAKARAAIPATEAMALKAFHKVEVAIAEHGTEWAVSSARDLDAALNGLASALKSIETIAAKVDQAYGVTPLALEGIQYTNTGGSILSSRDNAAALQISGAVQGLQKAAGLIHERIEVAKSAATAKADA
jgi:chorismate mutase